MNIIPFLIKEVEQEAKTTRKFFQLVNHDRFDWKPHEKSMDMKRLCTHIAQLPSWIDLAINTDGIDFASDSNQSPEVNSTSDLLDLLNKSEDKALAALQQISEDGLLETWTIKNGNMILNAMTKYEAIRQSFSQTSHHRAQLGVYLRVLNIPIPGSYGPSADEPSF